MTHVPSGRFQFCRLAEDSTMRHKQRPHQLNTEQKKNSFQENGANETRRERERGKKNTENNANGASSAGEMKINKIQLNSCKK